MWYKSILDGFRSFTHSAVFRYLVIGVLSFSIEFIAFNFFLYVLHIEALPANMLSLIISFSFNFIFSNSWTFKAGNSRNAQKLTKYLALIVVNYVLNNALFYIIHTWLVLSPNLTKVIVTGLQTSWTFVIYKFWIFKGSHIEDDPQVIM